MSVNQQLRAPPPLVGAGGRWVVCYRERYHCSISDGRPTCRPAAGGGIVGSQLVDTG
jgi:hypothetical protein